MLRLYCCWIAISMRVAAHNCLPGAYHSGSLNHNRLPKFMLRHLIYYYLAQGYFQSSPSECMARRVDHLTCIPRMTLLAPCHCTVLSVFKRIRGVGVCKKIAWAINSSGEELFRRSSHETVEWCIRVIVCMYL